MQGGPNDPPALAADPHPPRRRRLTFRRPPTGPHPPEQPLYWCVQPAAPSRVGTAWHWATGLNGLIHEPASRW